MTKMDWSKVRADDNRRRNAPLHTTKVQRFVMRSKHAGICPACGCSWKPLDRITPIGNEWVHWTANSKCAQRREAKLREEAQHTLH